MARAAPGCAWYFGVGLGDLARASLDVACVPPRSTRLRLVAAVACSGQSSDALSLRSFASGRGSAREFCPRFDPASVSGLAWYFGVGLGDLARASLDVACVPPRSTRLRLVAAVACSGQSSDALSLRSFAAGVLSAV